MRMTDYHARYFVLELTRRRAPDSDDKMATSVASATIDLNPHQIDAALFAFHSPLSRGAILADEVGLGKTIEAGLVVSQRWAERRRRILVITPANLRKQWHQELSEKFFLDCVILDGRSYKAFVKDGVSRPFEVPSKVVLCSYQFARGKESDVRSVPWDLVVIDEAHRLRNVYKPTNKTANALKDALAHAPKILLTATPLQNSILELYGLVSFIDERVFGDQRSFKEQFAYLRQEEVFAALKARLEPVCHRTLRRQVQAYVSYTRRHALVEEFRPSDAEDRLYDLVSEYLRRPNLRALPASQRTLITLVLRKLLASSTFAIAGALSTMSERLKRTLGSEGSESMAESLEKDYEAFESTKEEWEEDEEAAPTLSPTDREAIIAEIADLESFAKLASSIDHNAKGKALLKALDVGLRRAEALGAQRKAIIFTESRKTQDYLLRLLADTPYASHVVLFNGSNNDERSKEIYRAWLERHAGSDRVTGSRTADMRAALVEYFQNEGQIMIATEAGAEGINLQFCSLVVNYDLPWNPQRIEQRIGRCHRYGQKHDVVVVNFLNRKNEADLRVYQLLNDKFRLFEGVFGASDEVLGAIESGVDLEKRIHGIYQLCRQPEEIRAAFDALQLELSLEIDEAMTSARRKLLENFDDEVRDRLRVRDKASRESVSRLDQLLLETTQHELGSHAETLGNGAFRLNSNPFVQTLPDLPLGVYELPRRSGEAHVYRLGSGLAEAIVARAGGRCLDPVEITFDYGSRTGRVSALEPLQGTSGWLRLSLLTVTSLGYSEDFLVFAATDEEGQALDGEAVGRMFSLDGAVNDPVVPPSVVDVALTRIVDERTQALRRELTGRNARFFEAEVDKLDRWADDLKLGLARELKDLEKQLKEVRRAGALAVALEDKVEAQKRVKAMEAQRTAKRRTLYDAEDEIDRRRDNLIDEVQAKLEQSSSSEDVFTIRWVLQ